MLVGIKFGEIKVANNLIYDGHHRYLASLPAQYTIGIVPSCTTSATIQIIWTSVQFEEDDWDTSAKIQMLNEQDAYYNNITVVTLTELLNKV